MDCTIHGILQARILEWVAVPSPGDLPNPGIEPRSPALRVDSLPAEPQGKPEGKETALNVSSFYHSPLCTFWHTACFTVSWIPPKMVHLGGLLKDPSAFSSLPQWPTTMSKLSTEVMLMRNYSNTQKSIANFLCPELN